jgi:hypothetical protein
MTFFGGGGRRFEDLRLTESGLDAFGLNARSSTFTRCSAEPAGSNSVCSLRVPLGAGLRDLFEALGVPVHARELLLVVNPLLGVEEARRGLPPCRDRFRCFAAIAFATRARTLARLSCASWAS